MKTTSLALLFTCLLLSVSCSNKDTSADPCDNNGTICFNNKTDISVTVTIKEVPATITLAKDVMKCLTIKGNVRYSVNMAGQGFNKDTTINLSICDNKEILIVQ